MSSLFKNSFQSKQLKQFTESVTKAIPSIKRDTIKFLYKSIKSGNNEEFNSIESAINCLERKQKLDLQIASYCNIINDKENNTFSEVQSAKSYVVKLTQNDDTLNLIQQIERGFTLEKGSLSHPQASNTHLIPSKAKRRSVSSNKNNDPTVTEDDIDDKTAPNHVRSTTTVNPESLKALTASDIDDDETDPKQRQRQMKERKRSRSVMNLDINLRSRKSEPQLNRTKMLPMMNTKNYLQFLLEKAVINKAWNDNDADRLCKCAISMKCEWITVHSMWVNTCSELLRKYSIKKYKNDLKLHKKSMRRGSKVIIALKDFKRVQNEEEIKSECKICVTIGYPLGQTSTRSKIAETKQSVADGAQRVRLMVSAGKVIMEDWKYILREVKRVVAAANGCDVRIVFPDTKQITEEIKHTFNQKIMQGMAAKSDKNVETNNNNKKDTKVTKQRKLRCTFSDDESDDEKEHKRCKSVKSSPISKKHKKTRKHGKKYTKKDEVDDSESSDDESSASVCSSTGDTTPRGQPKIVSSKSEEQMIITIDQKINKKLLRVTADKNKNKNKNKNIRRASTMTSIKYKKTKAKKTTKKKSEHGNVQRNKKQKQIKRKKPMMINQSTTDILDIEPGAVTEKQKSTKKKKKKKKAMGKSVGALDELKTKKTKKAKTKSLNTVNRYNTKKNKNKNKDKNRYNNRVKDNNRIKDKNKGKDKDKKSVRKSNKLNKKNTAKRRAKSVGKLKTKTEV